MAEKSFAIKKNLLFTQIVTKLKNSKSDKTKKLKF